MRLVNRRTRLLDFLCIAAAASSGILILLRVADRGVGGCMNDLRWLRVPWDGGAANLVFAAVLDLVFDDGLSSSMSSLSRRFLRCFLFLLALVLLIFNGDCSSESLPVLSISCTLGSDCSGSSVLKSIDLVVAPSVRVVCGLSCVSGSGEECVVS